MGGLRHYRIARTARPMALASAVATLLAALFICLGQAGTGAATGTAEGAHGAGTGAHRVLTPASTTPSDAEYSCPYDRGDCGLFRHLSPAVLTAPPLDGPLDSAGLPPGPARAHQAARVPRTGALPRAPDLHVLQVLRT
ncbi:hypothetical protein ACWGI8_33995 [Streptomyces sp. NPDC054841]